MTISQTDLQKVRNFASSLEGDQRSQFISKFQSLNSEDAQQTLISRLPDISSSVQESAVDNSQSFLPQSVDSLIDQQRSQGLAPGSFIPRTTEEVKDIGKIAINFVPRLHTNSLSGFVGTGAERTVGEKIGPQVSGFETKTDFGNRLSVAADIALLTNLGTSVLGTVQKSTNSKKLSSLVKLGQKEFFPFVKQHTAAFGKAIKEGAKEASGTPIRIFKKELEAVFSPINSARPEALAQIPRVAKIATKNVDDALSLEDLLKKKAILRRSLSANERKGRITSERSKAIGEVIGNIDSVLKQKVSNISQANKEYATFIAVKNNVEKLRPDLARLPGKLGTEEGEKFLRRVLKFTDGEIEAFNIFENARGIEILKPARRAARLGQLVSALQKAVALTAAFGALEAIGAGKAVRTALDVAN